MLVAMAITLVMMGAVVTLFANVSNSVRDRRAVIEISGQLRHARNMLQQDLQGATCPGLTWRRPEENQGYIEIIEGPYREGNASALLDYDPVNNKRPPAPDNPEIDHTVSSIPSSNLLDTTPVAKSKWLTDGGGLGDYDDILMLTVRNDHEPFVGNMPANVRPQNAPNANANRFPDWQTQTIESPLAEVVWYAVENPGYTNTNYIDEYQGFFGEPGFRTIYRRTLLIAPWVNPYHYVDNSGTHDTFTEPTSNGGQTFTARPGLVRILRRSAQADEALAALIAFQERYDLSVRLEFDPLLDANNGGRWTLVANSLGDLTKRENRYEHHSLRPGSGPVAPTREFPFVVASSGSGYTAGGLQIVADSEAGNPGTAATANGILNGGSVTYYNISNPGAGYVVRPFAYLTQLNANGSVATTRVMLNDQGQVIRLLPGLVPLSGQRRGEDVMLSDSLAFDLRVFDPGAPLYATITNTADPNYPGTVLEPSDYGWATMALNNTSATKTLASSKTVTIGGVTEPEPTPIGTGAYVDLGYWNECVSRNVALGTTGWNVHSMPGPLVNPNGYGSTPSQFFGPMAAKSQLRHMNYNGAYDLTDLTDYDYCAYDTWSFHYENDGVNENLKLETALGETLPQPVDRGTNGLDDVGEYLNAAGTQFVKPTAAQPMVLLGPDDIGERETAPPYDKPLRGMQVIMRVYERDSRQIRQVSVNQHFVPE